MNFWTNIWNQPKTSAAGLLIAVASIAGVLSQQGVTLGKAGTGTVVTLLTAISHMGRFCCERRVFAGAQRHLRVEIGFASGPSRAWGS